MPSDDSDSISLVDTVARVAGYDALKSLKEQLGGQRIYIPAANAIRAAHPLVRAIGLQAALKVCAELHRTSHYVPRPTTKSREAIILWAARIGLSRSETARHADCTETYVYKILALARAAGRLPQREQSPLWRLMGYESFASCPEAASRVNITCGGRSDVQQRWPVIAWAKLAGLGTDTVAGLIGGERQQVLYIVGRLRRAGYLSPAALPETAGLYAAPTTRARGHA
ncbi:hypothetical protein [Sphingobium ummariense]|nr:hypothetical protein [Sphingobium ummariense]